MKASAQVLPVFFLCAVAVGCIPIPAKTVARYGVQARLVDATNGVPLAKVFLSVSIDGHECNRKTNRDGEFRVPPDWQHFWTWLGGPWRSSTNSATVDIASPGYVSYHEMIVAEPSSRQDGYIMLGDIDMKRRQPYGAANRSQPVGSETNRTPSAAGSGG